MGNVLQNSPPNSNGFGTQQNKRSSSQLKLDDLNTGNEKYFGLENVSKEIIISILLF